jgi:hypothetical protein
MSNLNLALTLSLNDRLVAPIQRALNEVAKGAQAIEKDLLAMQKAGGATGQTLAGMQGPAMAAKQAAELARNTQNALSLADRLKNAFSAAGNVVKGLSAGVAGIAAAKFVLAAPLEKARSYETQLANAANIAYEGKDKATRQAGMKDMDATVTSAVRSGGGTRESALVGLNTLFAANIDKDVVKELMPHIQKYSTAGNANPENIANLVIFGLRSQKLSKEQIPLMLDKTLASTNKGSMELDNLAKWMPQIGAQGALSGMSGMKGYEEMLAGIQTSRLTAGTKDEAGTNFKDFMSHLTGHALKTAGKRAGINVVGTLAKHLESGGNVLEGAVLLSDYIVNRDPRQKALQTKLDAGGVKRDRTGKRIYSPEQEAIMQQQSILFAGSALGDLFHNQQSMQALVALRNNRDYFKENLTATGEAKGQIGEGNMELLRDTSAFKKQQSENEQLFALTNALNPVNSALGKLSDETTELYRKYPTLGAVMQGTGLAVKALSAAALGSAGAVALFGLALKKQAAEMGLPGKPGAITTTATGLAAATPLITAGVIAGGVVLGAGYLMSEAMNTPQALGGRIDTRNQRINELQDLANLDPSGKYAPEIDRLKAEVDALRTKYGEQVGGGRGVVNPPMNVNVYLDGAQIQSSVNGRNDRTARRN